MSVGRRTRLAWLPVVIPKSKARARRVLGQDGAASGGDAAGAGDGRDTTESREVVES